MILANCPSVRHESCKSLEVSSLISRRSKRIDAKNDTDITAQDARDRSMLSDGRKRCRKMASRALHMSDNLRMASTRSSSASIELICASPTQPTVATAELLVMLLDTDHNVSFLCITVSTRHQTPKVTVTYTLLRLVPLRDQASLPRLAFAYQT